jgi:hypothetical protein
VDLAAISFRLALLVVSARRAARGERRLSAWVGSLTHHRHRKHITFPDTVVVHAGEDDLANEVLQAGAGIMHDQHAFELG